MKGASFSAGMEHNWRKRNIIAINQTLRTVVGRGRDSLVSAMRYALFTGGKRLRPLLCLATAEVFNISPASRKKLLQYACALELVHTYSLVHDDLPCMDDDQLRRGKPACHVKYGEGTALLAGDALLTLAFETMAASGDAQACKVLAQSAGVAGMIGGQSLDIANEAGSLTALQAMHKKKTGCLFAAALMLGGLGAKISASKLDKLAKLGLELGLLYQIKDDMNDAASTGTASGDRSKQRTCVSMLGLAKTHELLSKQQKHVTDLLAKLCANDTHLGSLCVHISSGAS